MNKTSAIANLLIVLVPILFLITVTSFYGLPQRTLVTIAFTLSVSALILFFIAKLPKFKKRDFLSFGIGGVSKQKLPYIAAWVALFIAFSAWIALAVSLNN